MIQENIKNAFIKYKMAADAGKQGMKLVRQKVARFSHSRVHKLELASSPQPAELSFHAVPLCAVKTYLDKHSGFIPLQPLSVL